MDKSIAAENPATLNGQNLIKWLKTKNLCYKQHQSGYSTIKLHFYGTVGTGMEGLGC